MSSNAVSGVAVAALALAGAAIPAGPPQSSPSADTIVAHYIDAIGGQTNLDAIQSVIIRGSYTEQGRSEPAQLARMRPFYKLVGDPLNRSKEFEEGYDGSAWEYYGDPGIVLRTVGPAAAAARHGLYILGSLVDSKKQGSVVTLMGMAKIDGRNAYQLRVRMLDGFEQDEFVDAKTWLLIADRKIAKVHAFGREVASETRWSDYRTVNGVRFAFLNIEVEIATGKELNRFQTDRIDVNAKLVAAMFMPPQLQRTPLQALMDQLFQERDDTEAVRWTYHGFRTAYPKTNTEVAAEVIGYQALKMGNTATAIALLEDNQRDYPRSAAADFGLGRAYRAAGRTAEAKTQFERALSIDPQYERAKAALAE
jgi:tetratricopeptide (TPR) repeat protein